jgi:creatinine amidohydrolase
MIKSGYWQTLATDDFRGLDPDRTVVVLPVAAVEQHGPHLPLGTDALISRGIVDATLARLGVQQTVLVLPPLEIGASAEHMDFAGTLSIDNTTLSAVWLDVGASVARAGLRKLVILNTHGGQRSIVDLAALRLRIDHDMLVARCNYFSFGAPDGLFDADEWSHGIHGGEVETSLMLHLHPELVRREALQDFASLGSHLARGNRWLGVEKPVGIGWKAQDLNTAGVAGNAARADAGRGASYLGYLADCFKLLLEEVADAPLGIVADLNR